MFVTHPPRREQKEIGMNKQRGFADVLVIVFLSFIFGWGVGNHFGKTGRGAFDPEPTQAPQAKP